VKGGTTIALLVKAGVREALASECEELFIEVRNGQESTEINGKRAARALFESERLVWGLGNGLKDRITVRLCEEL
jgi:hypothetical protein